MRGVHGLAGLRVADASVIAVLPTGDTKLADRDGGRACRPADGVGALTAGFAGPAVVRCAPAVFERPAVAMFGDAAVARKSENNRA